MNDKERLREAAMVISDLLASAIYHGEGRECYSWEEAGLRWLQEQLKADPDTAMNAFTYFHLREADK